MKYEVLTNDQYQFKLDNYNVHLNNIYSMRIHILKGIKDLNDLYESICLKGINYNNLSQSSGKGISNPTFSSYIKLERESIPSRLLYEQARLIDLKKQEDELVRVEEAFFATESFYPEGFKATYALVFENSRMRVTWEKYSIITGRSKATLSGMIKNTISLSACIYNSSYSSDEIKKMDKEMLIKIADEKLLKNINKLIFREK